MLFPRPFRPSAHLLRPGEDRLGAQLIIRRKSQEARGSRDTPWHISQLEPEVPQREVSDFQPFCPSSWGGSLASGSLPIPQPMVPDSSIWAGGSGRQEVLYGR